MKAKDWVRKLSIGDYIDREDIIDEDKQIIISAFDGKGYRTKNACTKHELLENIGEDDGRYDEYDENGENYILAEDLRYPGSKISTSDGLWIVKGDLLKKV